MLLKVLIKGGKLDESKRLKIGSLDKIVNEGRYVNMLNWDQLKLLFASFCTEKERESVTKYSQPINLSFRLAVNNYIKELKGTTMSDKMSPAKLFILTVTHNYLVCDTHEALEWKPDNAQKNCFKNIKQRGALAGWSQDFLVFCFKNGARD